MGEDTLKNVRLVPVEVDGHETWKLLHLGDGGNEWSDPYFNHFAEQMLPGRGDLSSSRNTRYNYSRWVAHFLDFMIEATHYEVEQGRGEMSGSVLVSLIRKYPKWLADGAESGDELVREVSIRLGSKPCKYESQSTIISAVNMYLTLSEDFNAVMRELGHRDIAGLPVFSEVDLFPESLSPVPLTEKKRFALNKNSMLAGVISGGARLKNLAKLSPIARRTGNRPETQGLDPEDFYENSHFPFEHGPKLITLGFKLKRDKALFCFLMACGCRLHEALLLTWRDIDASRQIVRLRCPYDKSLDDFGGYFTNRSQISDLPWKGRATERTSLIQPYKFHFWRLLAEYQKSEEFTLTSRHNFIFQITRGENKGAPLIMSDHSNIGKTMVEACKRIGIDPMRPHSLRHMYGVYCLNFLPFDDGTYGMGLLAVKDLMGHASATTTQRYAIPDTRMQMLRQRVNYSVLRDFTVNTGNQMRIEMLRKEQLLLEAEIQREVERERLGLPLNSSGDGGSNAI